jgi:chemotaxis regulatin CheY-phosphate phosphatase CheZ
MTGMSMSAITTQVAENAIAFETIEAAVNETGRGRWFLAEYARRNRHADTLVILATLEAIQATLSSRALHLRQEDLGNSSIVPGTNTPGDIANDILDIGRAIARTQRDIRAIRSEGLEGEQFISASDSLGSVVQTTEKATSTILSAAERVQEYAWTMRENNGNIADCDMLDACASEIYTACTFQDLTAQRIQKVVDTLRFIDERVASMVRSMGLAETLKHDLAAEETNTALTLGVRAEDIWMSEAHQAEIDETFEFFTPAEKMAEPTMVGAEAFDMQEDDQITDQHILEDAAPLNAPSLVQKDVQEATPTATPDSANLSEKQNVTELLNRMEEMQTALSPAISEPASGEPFAAYDGLSTEERLRSFR